MKKALWKFGWPLVLRRVAERERRRQKLATDRTKKKK